MYWAGGVFSSEELAGVLASASICFDFSVIEIFVPLSWGGKVILVENALELATLSEEASVRVVNVVLSAMAEHLRTNAIPASVRAVNLGGETLHRALADQVHASLEAGRVFNLYGPSEGTTCSTYACVSRGDRTAVSIGQPISNTRVYVLNERLEPVPIGVSGGLYISGDGLAR